MDLHEIFSIDSLWANRHKSNTHFTQPHLPQLVITNNDHSHPIETNAYKPSYLGQILMDIHKIFSIFLQWLKDMN